VTTVDLSDLAEREVWFAFDPGAAHVCLRPSERDALVEAYTLARGALGQSWADAEDPSAIYAITANALARLDALVALPEKEK
jgi:hypothetical protein